MTKGKVKKRKHFPEKTPATVTEAIARALNKQHGEPVLSAMDELRDKMQAAEEAEPAPEDVEDIGVSQSQGD